MSQGITIKGKTPDGKNVEVQVDDNGVVQVNLQGGSSGGGAPSAAYGIMNTEDTGTYKYFGFENKDGAWYIMRKTLATNVFLYASGASNYSAAWTGRAGQTYQAYSGAF